MKEFKINAQDDILNDIIYHLKNGHMGIAFTRDWNYERKGNNLYFTLKEGHEAKMDVIFWLGYLTNN